MSMRKLLCSVAALFLIQVILVAKTPNPLTIEKIADKIYVIKGADSNSTALITDNGVLVVDFGNLPSMGNYIIDIVRTVTKQPITDIILTHYHEDHVSGLSALPSTIRIIGHENIKRSFESISFPQWKDLAEVKYPDYVAKERIQVEELRKQKSPDLKKAEDELNADLIFLEDYKKVQFINPTIEYSDKMAITFGGESIIIQHYGPAHSTTDSIVFFPRQKILCSGDLIFNEAFPYVDKKSGANTANWIIALMALYLNYDCVKVVPGHGPVGDHEIIENQRRLLTDLRMEVKTVYAQGKTLAEAKDLISMNAYRNMQWFANLNRAIEAVYAELEGSK